MMSNNRVIIILSAFLVIGIILIGTGLFLNVFTPGNGGTTTTTDTNTTTTTITTAPTTTVVDIHNPYQVAIVFTTGGLGDKSFNDGVYGGLLDAKLDYNINFTYEEPTQILDYEQFHRSYAAHAAASSTAPSQDTLCCALSSGCGS